MTTEIRFEPTLFIFLGTSSGQIGWRLKELFRKAYGDVPILRFLWIDADSTIDPQAASGFRPSERVELVGFNGDAVLANLNNYPTIKSWWPRASRLKAGFISRGAGQMRPVGRLSLFRMFNDRTTGPAFIDKLRQATESIQQIEHIDATERMSTEKHHFVVERGSVRVVMFFSTCGGTGSSMTFDIAYLCRHFLRDLNPSIMSVAILPSIIDKAIKNETPTQRERIRANTYAWFRESNHLLEKPYWQVTYPEGAPVNVQAPPFDMTFVLELGNQAGNRLNSDEDIFNMIASAIFLDTGSSIGGAMRGFNANVSVLLEEFRGRQRAYSSLAAASLIYPAEKILNYCSARLGANVIRNACLRSPDPREVEDTAIAILARMRLQDDQILEDLLADAKFSGLNIPAIRKAENIEEIRRLLALQEETDSKEREYIKTKITERVELDLERFQDKFQDEATRLILDKNAQFAQAVLVKIAGGKSSGTRGADREYILSQLSRKITQQGIHEMELATALSEYQRSQQRLRRMSGDAIRTVQRLLLKKTWLEGLNRARNDCLSWVDTRNQRDLQLHAQRQAIHLYSQLGEYLRSLSASLAGLLQILERAGEKLDARAIENLKPLNAEEGIYELTIEAVDTGYIRHFYEKRMGSLNPVTVYHSFSKEQEVDSWKNLLSWGERKWADGIQENARGYFYDDVENTSLLEALTEYYGKGAAAKIEKELDRLVRYCHPFWQFDTNSGIQGQEGKSIIGVEDERSDLIPAKYHEDTQYEIKSTGFLHRIDFARVQHGLPAFLLRNMGDYKAFYEEKRKGIDPLHVFPEAFSSSDVMPEEKQETRNLFAIAAAFDYVIQIGSFYYFDPEKDYSQRQIRPVREYRLDQGREKAENAFIQRDDLARLAEELIERDVVNIGNKAAIALLDGKINEYKKALSDMPPDGALRHQFEREITALQDKQSQLGKL
ncbi:MAG: hypothetical protein HN392_11260 [Anaerolineae bacterium]|nr:hypothetical protein [Anaerolineae bacterium]